MGSWENFFVFNPILMKLGEVVVSMGTTTSPSFIKIGLKTKKFSHEPISGTFECGVNNHTVEVHHLYTLNMIFWMMTSSIFSQNVPKENTLYF